MPGHAAIMQSRCAAFHYPVVPVASVVQTIMRSFLGVGAPEAILVAVVALVVFGPKGLADVSAPLLRNSASA